MNDLKEFTPVRLSSEADVVERAGGKTEESKILRH
jgi:hypothetical protein